jgi:hypothetical protein
MIKKISLILMLAFSQINGKREFYPTDREIMPKMVAFICSLCHNWDLETLKSFVDDNHLWCIYEESETGQSLLTEYTLLNKTEHVEYLLSYLLPYHKVDCFACKNLDRQVIKAFLMADDKLIQLFQNYFQKQKLNLPPAGYQWR